MSDIISAGVKVPGEVIEFTEEQTLEIARCMDDPIYFIKNYIKIVHLDKGLTAFDMYPFQEDLVNIMHNNRYAIFKLPRQSGKCLSINSNVKVRNKKTGEIVEMTVGELFNEAKLGRK